MEIQYVANGSRRLVRDPVANELINRGLARAVYQTRHLVPEPAEKAEPLIAVDKPKRAYRRRKPIAKKG